ncbi:MAG: DUF4349 domain-containing protein [Mahellales bacterium]|jgi:hypothetical protein
MKCQDCIDLLSQYLDNKLEEDKFAQVEKHLAQCEKCQRIYEDLKAIVSACGSMEEIEPPAELNGIIKERIKEERKRSARKASWKAITAVAAAVLVIFVSMIGYPGNRLFTGGNDGSMESPTRNEVAQDMAMPEEARQGLYDDEAVQSEMGMSAPAAEPAPAYPADVPSEQAKELEAGMDIAGRDYDYAASSAEGVHGLQERKIIKSAYVSLETDEFQRTIDTITGKVVAVGGYIENSELVNSNREGELRRANYQLRVPKNIFDQFILDLNQYGNVSRSSIQGEDITGQYFDVDTRVKTLKAQEQRVLQLLAKAEKLEDIINIERELSYLRNEIEMLTGTLKNWDNMISYSKVVIDIYEVKSLAAIETGGTGLASRLKNGFISSIYNLGKVLAGILIFIVSVLPFVLVIVVVAIIVKAILKRRRILKEE